MSNYETTAPLHARGAFNAAHGTKPWLAWVASHLPPRMTGMRVLDAGCGPGWLWDAVDADDRVDLTLLDASDAMVRTATARAASFDPTSVVAGIEALPDLGPPFDVVVCAHVLYHLEDPGGALDGLRDILARGGTLIATTIAPDDLAEVNALTREAYGHDPVAPLHERFGAPVAERLLASRFASVARHDFHDRYDIRDADLLASHILSIPPGPDLSREEAHRIRSLCAARIAGAGGTLSSDRRQVLFVARPSSAATRISAAGQPVGW